MKKFEVYSIELLWTEARGDIENKEFESLWDLDLFFKANIDRNDVIDGGYIKNKIRILMVNNDDTIELLPRIDIGYGNGDYNPFTGSKWLCTYLKEMYNKEYLKSAFNEEIANNCEFNFSYTKKTLKSEGR